MAQSIDLSVIASNLGAYDREKKGIKQIEFYSGLQSVEKAGIALETGIRDQQEYVIPFIADILQKGDASTFNWTQNAIGFATKRWQVNPWKVDIKITPQDFKATWLAAYESPSRNPYNLTLVEMMYEMILNRLKANLETTIWSGVYSGSANPAQTANVLAVTNGFKKQVVDAIAATETTVIATGAITSSNAVAKFEQMWLGLDDELKYVKSVIYCSPTQAINYITNYKALNNNQSPNFIKLYDQTRVGLFNADVNFMRAFTLDISGDSCIVMPVLGLSGSSRLILQTMQGGGMLAVGVGDEADMGNMIVEYRQRNIEIMMDGSIGTAVSCFTLNSKKYVLVNDQA